MSFVILSNCRACHKLYCAQACPADCIVRSESSQALIVSANCIDCGDCETSCPFDAVCSEDEKAHRERLKA